MRSSGNSTPTAPSPIDNGDDGDLMMLLEKLQVFRIQGRDKRGRKILRIVGKFFPAGKVGKADVLRRYLEDRIFPELLEKKNNEGDGCAAFCIVYVHTRVQRSENFPGVSALRSIYESLPVEIRNGLKTVYFVHPGIQSRLFLATIGRFLFSAGLYEKVRYVSRLEFLWEHVRKGELEFPEFVCDHDDDLEYRPLMDYGIEANHHRAYEDAATMDSLRCIS